MKTIHMKNEITSDMIEKLEILAQLELTEAERQQAVGNLNQIVDYFSQIGRVQTNGVEPVSCVHMTSAPLRKDVPKEPDSEYSTGMTDNAPALQDNMIVVPRSFM